MHLCSSGIPGLDDSLGGGFPKNGAVLVHGQTGSGKTILGLQFLLEGLKKGEKTVYITLDHKPKRLISQAKSFGWDIETYMKCGLFSFIDATEEHAFSSPESFRELWQRCFNFIQSHTISRVVVDPFRFLETDYEFMCVYRETLLQLDAQESCSSLIAIHSTDKNIPTEASWCSGVISLQMIEESFGMVRKIVFQKFIGMNIHLNSTRYYIDSEKGLYVPLQNKVNAWQPS